MFSTSDTIVAIATPHGRGGVGMVRLSGPDAERIGQALIGREDPLEPRRATFARVVAPVTGSSPGPEGPGLQPPATRILDQAVVTFFPGPNSYTGEDVVEISGHGSPLLLRRIVELAMTAGARLAEPGEFTLRAYLNERIDLVQAEAVADLIEAVTPLQARVAMDQLEGTLTGALARIDADLFDLTARLEASLDFPDEGFHFITREQLQQEIWRTGRDISALTSQGRAGRVVREGRIVAILGRPNAGKSSLFNALVGAARAIVTDIPGTTRDMLSERVDIDGMAVTLVDTAGLREAGDAIEAEGVARARQAQQVAALSLVIVDGAAPLAAEDRRLAGADPARTLVVVSKSDLPAAWPRHEIGDRALEISALTGAGLDELRRRLGVALTGREELRDPPCISNARHLALLDEARRSVDRAAEALASGATEELILVDLGAARRALEEITGRRSPDDLLAHIFSRFCVGK
jgi:tRNA modification GTPase